MFNWIRNKIQALFGLFLFWIPASILLASETARQALQAFYISLSPMDPAVARICVVGTALVMIYAGINYHMNIGSDNDKY